jgi:hypothetical protein
MAHGEKRVGKSEHADRATPSRIVVVESPRRRDQTAAMTPVPTTPEEVRAKLEAHFGAARIPAKHLSVLDWWRRLRADPNAPPRMRMACERDLEEIIGPVLGEPVEWVMVATA